MKKLYIKDKKLRNDFKRKDKKYYLLKLILVNKSNFLLLRYNAYELLKNLLISNYSVSISNRCFISYNRKRFNKNTYYSRTIFLKLIQQGEIVGYQKAS